MDELNRADLMLKCFSDLCDMMKDERGLGNNDFEEYLENNSAEEEELNADSSMWNMSLRDLISPPRGLDEFPEQKAMPESVWDINPDDPEFWTGKSLGIPVGVVIRQSNGDDKLLPIIDGKFQSYGL